MLGIIYLFLCFCVGWAVCSLAFPGLNKFTDLTYDNRSINLSPYMLIIPAWFVTGVLTVTWPVYLIALLASNTSSPLTIANCIVLPAALVFFVLTLYYRKTKNEADSESLLCKDSKTRVKEWILLGFIFLLAIILMFSTFYVKDNKLYIGVSVFSDFSPHIGMIRSFSYGNNFLPLIPTMRERILNIILCSSF